MKTSINSLNNLKPNKSHWSSGETVVIRIPKYLRDTVLEIAKKLDNKGKIIDKNSTVTVDKLKEILAKIDNKEKGYRSNSATQLIKDLKELL